jgi:hypothetical protein
VLRKKKDGIQLENELAENFGVKNVIAMDEKRLLGLAKKNDG